MSPLARSIYAILRELVPAPDAQIQYGELCARLRNDMSPRSPALAKSLGEIVRACRARGLPALSAIVVQKGSGMPGDGYYGEAHGGMDLAHAMRAWSDEVAAVRATTYPDEL